MTLAESLRRNDFEASLRLPAQTVEELLFLGKSVSASTPSSGCEPSILAPLEKIAQDPTVRTLAALYLGRTPIYQGGRLWWTRPGAIAEPTATGSRFHYDLYDYSAVAFLFYLTDVDQDTGPHVCVRGSHRSRVVRSYGAARIVTICGPAGTVIAEDPFCFHKVKLPTKGERLAAQLLYTGGDFPVPFFSRAEISGGRGRSRARDRD